MFNKKEQKAILTDINSKVDLLVGDTKKELEELRKIKELYEKEHKNIETLKNLLNLSTKRSMNDFGYTLIITLSGKITLEFGYTSEDKTLLNAELKSLCDLGLIATEQQINISQICEQIEKEKGQNS